MWRTVQYNLWTLAIKHLIAPFNMFNSNDSAMIANEWGICHCPHQKLVTTGLKMHIEKTREPKIVGYCRRLINGSNRFRWYTPIRFQKYHESGTWHKTDVIVRHIFGAHQKWNFMQDEKSLQTYCKSQFYSRLYFEIK